MDQKFFLYARKSTDVEDKQVLSIESQLAELREYAAREKLVIVDELVEKQSAKIPGRPIFNLMLDKIEKGNAGGILSWHPDRLARNSIDGGKIIYLLDTGIIQTLKFPSFWFESTPQGKFMLSIAFGQSKYYVDSLSENTKRGLRQKVRRGECPGIAPIGYINDLRTKMFARDKKKAPVIAKLFKLYSKGNFTLKDGANFLTQNGILSRGGNSIKLSRVSYILSDPVYYGHFRFGGELHEGKHEPIITKKLFDQVNEELKRRSNPWKKARIEKVSKPFTGLLRCGECNMMITVEQKKKYYKRTDHHACYTYYRCTKKSKTTPCSQGYIREEDLNTQLTEMLQKVSFPPDWKEPMLNLFEKDKTENFQSGIAIVCEKKEEVKKLNSQLQFLLDSYLDQVIERNDYLNRKADLMGKKKTFEEQIVSLEQGQNNWLEPMREWIIEAAETDKIINGTDPYSKKVLAGKVFGSNLVLINKTARGEALGAWAALRAAPSSLDLVARRGVGPLLAE